MKKPIVVEVHMVSGSLGEFAEKLYDKLYYGRVQLKAGTFRVIIEPPKEKEKEKGSR